jgi:hypothetical protein
MELAMTRIPDTTRRCTLLVAAVLLAACSKGAARAGSPPDGAAGDGGQEASAGNAAGSSGNGSADAGGSDGGSHAGGGSAGAAAAGGRGGAGGATAAAGAGGAGECNALANTAPYIQATALATDVPASQGGTPAPGTYYLTAWNWYSGVSGATADPHEELAETVWLTVAGNDVTIQLVENSGPVTVNTSQTMTLTLSGTTMATLQYSCPSPSAAAPVPYSANPTTFTLFALGRGYVYTKQSEGPIDLVSACKAMKDDFTVAFLAAQKCDPTAASQCQSAVDVPMLGCPSCQVSVQDLNGLEAMTEHFGQAGCATLPGYTCATSCAGPVAQCMAQSAGGGVCVAN